MNSKLGSPCKNDDNQFDFCTSKNNSDDEDEDQEEDEEEEEYASEDLKTGSGKRGQREFFKVTFMAAMLNVPQFMLSYLNRLNPDELYRRAIIVENLKFNQYSEWIDMEIKKQMYRRDSQFLELELQYIHKMKIQEAMKFEVT